MNKTIFAKKNLLILSLGAAGFFLGLFFAPPDAQAVQIKRVQTGDVYFDADDMSATIPCQTVDQSKTLVLLYPMMESGVSANTGNQLFTSMFETDSTFVVNRDYAATGSLTLRWYLVEFEDGVFIQRGISSFIYGTTYYNSAYRIKDVTLPVSVDADKSFTVVQVRGNMGYTTVDELFQVRSRMIDDTTMRLERDAVTDANRTINMVWQVVEFQTDASIRSGQVLLDLNQTSNTGTISPAIPAGKIDRCLLLFDSMARGYTTSTSTGVDGIEGYYRVTGAITDESTVTFSRTVASTRTNAPDPDVNVNWYVIEFTDESTRVQHDSGEVTLASGSADSLLSVTAFDPSRSIPFYGVRGPNDTSTNTYADDTLLTPQFDQFKGMAHDPSTGSIWVCNYYDNSVSKFNASTGALTGTYDVGTKPISVCYDSQNQAIWTANYGSNNVTKLNASNGNLVGTYTVGTGPMDIEFATTSNSIWTVNYGSQNITKITASSGAVAGTYALASANPTSICYSTETSNLFVCYWSAARITRVNPTTGALSETTANITGLGTSQYYCRIRYADTSTTSLGYDTVWLASQRYNYLIRIRVSSPTSNEATFYPDLVPNGMAWDSVSQTLWVTNYASNTVIEIDPTLSGEAAAIASYTTDNNPFDAVWDTTNSKIWIANAGSLSLQRFAPDGTLEGTYRKGATEDTLAITRKNTACNAYFNWSLVEFSPLTLKSPNGGEVWRIGQEQNITWKHAQSMVGSTVDLKLDAYGGLGSDLTANTGDEYSLPITSAVDASLDTYAWDVPEQISGTNILQNDLKVRIIKTGTTTTDRQYDDSNANFEIKGTITVTQPNGGQTDWYVGDTNKNITWTKKGNFDTAHDPAYCFNIYLSENGGTSYDYTVVSGLLQSVVCSGDSCSWTWEDPDAGIVGIPDKVGNNRRIRIALNGDESNVKDESDADFSIRGVLTVTSPNTGNEIWLAQQDYNITWDKKGTFSPNTVTLKYSLNSGADYFYTITTAAAAGTTAGSYSWNDIPVSAIGDYVRVKVISEDSVEALRVEDASDADFKIVPSVRVDDPNSSSIWYVSNGATISWTLFGDLEKVHCWYSKDGGAWTRITPVGGVSADSGDGTGSYPWGSVEDIVNTNVVIRVANRGNEQDDNAPGIPFDDSEAFTVKGKLTMTAPNGGEVWQVGDTSRSIQWNKFGTIGDVRIYFARNGVDYSLLVEDIATSSYTWDPIPDLVTSTGKIRVELMSDSSVSCESANPFSIKGKLQLLTPNGGGSEVFSVGDTASISWTATGTIGNVELRYSTDSGSTFPDGKIIRTVAQDASPQSWSIPDAISTTVKVRVNKVGDITLNDASDADFRIKGALTITSPNAGTEAWEVGTIKAVTWTRLGSSMGNVKLEYSVTGVDGAYKEILASTPSSALSCNWTVPDDISTLCRVKITSLDDTDTFDKSDANFRIKGRFVLEDPSGGQTWLVGEKNDISWTTYGTIGNVKLFYSTDDGESFPYSVPPVNPVENSEGWEWTIPDAIGTQVKVRVEDSNNSDVYVESNAITVKGKITVTSPNGGEVWKVGETRSITWVPYGSLGTVKIEYSTNGGSGYSSIAGAAEIDADALTYSWTVPDAVGTNLKIRITSNTYTDVSDESNNAFEVQPVLNLTAPNSGTFYVGDATPITWSKTGTVDTVRLEYSTDGGSSYSQISGAESLNAATGTPFSWTIPDAIDTDIKVRVVSNADDDVRDDSNSNFEIKGKLSLGVPNGSESWEVGTEHAVTWTRTGSIANVKLKFSTNSGVSYPDGNTIVASTGAAAGSYPWTIPDQIYSTMRVRVSDAADDTVADTSDADFTIKGKLVITSPVGGETVFVGASQPITWTTYGTVSQVELFYSTDGGTSYGATIGTPPLANNGTYPWIVPDAIGTQLRVKVRKFNDDTVADTSDANFTIKGSVTLSSPNGSETWIVGSSHNITWTKTGNLGTVKLLYSTDGGASYPDPANVIASVPSGDLAYLWAVPDAIGQNLRVKIEQVSDTSINDESNNSFIVKGSITVNTPNGGEALIIASTDQTITWAKQGTIGNIKIEYSTDSGASYPNLVTASTGSAAGSYSWNPIPNTPSTQCRVRLTALADDTVVDESNADFRIKASITLTSPNGGESWIVNSGHAITWTKTGSVPTVALEYSRDGGATYPEVIIGSTSGEALSYGWTVPDAIDNDIRVQVRNTGDSTVFDRSDADFSIRGALTVGFPNGGQVLAVNSAQTITWTRTGSIASVKIDYSTDGGASYPNPIVASTPAEDLSYPWTVPDAIFATCKIKVSDANDALNVFDVSDSNFKIRGALTVLYPSDGGVAWPINSSQNITWSRTGSIANVKIEYSTNAFANEDQTALIVASTGAAAGTYTWASVDDAPGANVKVRVSDALDSTVLDLSNNPFSIKGTLTVTAPNGGEELIVGASTNITWTKLGNIASVKLMLSKDSGSTYAEGDTIVASAPASDLEYGWTIPDAITSQCRVKIIDLGDPTVTDQSDADFIIKGSVQVTAPNGGQNWFVGDTQNITWTRTGSFANVKLEYSKNGFSDELQTTVITTSAPAAGGSYAWTVEDAIGTGLKVRVSDAANSSVSDVSNAVFTIKGKLTLLSPNGSEAWVVGESRNVTWTRTGSIANVKLEYSTDGGTSFPNVIVASTSAATGSYTWTVSDAIDNDIRVRVSDVGDSTVLDASDNNFTIKGALTVSAPNGGEVWVVDSLHDIVWTRSGSIATVKLEYSTNAFFDELETTVISASTDATGTPSNSFKYEWQVPDAIDDTIKVRITDTSDGTVKDTSNNNFKIKGAFQLTAPNGGENWAVGSSHSVTWLRTGTVTAAKLDFSVDGGAYTNSIVASTPGGGLSYEWTIPDNISTQVRVKISDANDASSVFDTSDADFAIMGGFAITSPNGSEVWVVNSQHDIAWTTTGTVANVKLDYSTDGGGTYPHAIIAATANNSPFNWTVPDAISNTVRVKISDANNANAFDTSNANFKIKGALTLSAPNGSEVWSINAHNDITWTRTGSVANIKLEYSTNGFSDELQTETIVASVAGTPMTYDWLIPDSPSSTVKVRITDAADATVTDVSNATFRIIGSLTVTAPNGGEQWIVNENQNVTWTKFGNIANVKLMYSTDAGVTYPAGNTIVASTSAGNFSYTWTIPDTISGQCRVKIFDVGDDSVADQSDANFTIKGSVTLTAPDGGENWVVGENQSITWTRNGSFANVKLEYSKNGFSDELQTTVITASTPAAAGTYSWTVADAIGTGLKVRVSDAANSSVSDVSNAVFTIKGALNLTSPNGGETWIVGESRSVTWTRTGSIANVKLEYSINGGTGYPNVIIVSTPAAAGSYGWTVADAIGGDVRIRVSDASDSTVNDASAASFTIKGALLVTAPNGNETWVVDDVHAVTWTRSGSIANVKLEYSTNGFADELQVTTITNSTDASTGTYNWTVPDAIGTTLKVRATNVADDTVKDVSDVTFRIVGSVTLSSPNGSEQWVVGDEHNVTWTKHGSIANVRLEFSKDGGANYNLTITNSAPAGGLSYAWTIPDHISTQVMVKISDASNADVFDVSDAVFSIRGGFTVSSPNGSEVWVVGDVHDITWSTNGTISNVKLEYSTDGGTSYPSLIIASTSNTNSYSWTVPDAISITCKVRVSDANNAAANDESNNNFKIKGSLRVTSPNTGMESWAVGYTSAITWDRTGSVQSINLYYSAAASHDDWLKINGAAVDASLGTWDWALPGDTDLSTTALIRIIDASDGTVTDTSNNEFQVKGGLRVETPSAAGISMQVGNSYKITWTKFGNIPNVKIHYSVNGGVLGVLGVGGTYPETNLIGTEAASVQEYMWAVPDRIGTTLRIRVMQEDNTNVWDESDNLFEVKGRLQVLQPNGAETWFVGDTNDIQWRPYGTFTSQVKLEYSTNAFANEDQTVLIATVPAGVSEGTSTYGWTTPNAIGGSLKIRATDANNATVTDVSDSTFTIKGKLNLMTPNGGETWVVGTSQNITWQRTGTIVNVKLEYSTDNGSTYPNTISASTDGSTGTYAWTIPDAIGTNLRVRISDASDATVNDVSNATFTVKGALTLTAPNGGDAWSIGTTRNVTWTRTGSITNVKLEYSIDGGVSYPTPIVASTDASTGTYSWVIPDNPGNTTKVKISDVSDSSVFDISDANFKIIGAFTLTAPNGGEGWGIGTGRNIAWTRTGSIANAKLQYSTNSGASYDYTITASTPAGGLEYSWTIPDSPTIHARVKISDAADVTVFDTSDADFSIQGIFTVTAPNGSEVLTVGGSQSIAWTCVGSVTNVKLQYSTNGGASYDYTIADSIANSLEYSWTVPDAISSQVRVRIADVNDDAAFDASNGNFKIKGALLVLSPNGTENWVVGTSHPVTWSRTGSVSTLKLEYSKNGGTDNYPYSIANSVDASLGTYAWTIPDAIGSQLRVKITDTSDSTVFDVSDVNFSIKGAVTVTSPNGGENWIVNSGHAVTWTRTGTIANVKLDYSKNSGTTFPFAIVASTDASTGTYSWTIPDDLSTAIRVRVMDVSDSSVFDASDADFAIGGAVTVSAPNGGQIWYVGEARNITWVRSGSIPQVKLEYSTNGGFSYDHLIIAATDAAAETYAWSVADAIGDQVRVKITDTTNAAVTDNSDANFTIKGVLSLTSPNGGETWVVGENRSVTWARTGSIANVKLEYSTDNGTTYPNTIIASTPAASGSYAWVVPDSIGSNLRVKASDVSDASVFDASNASFTVRGSILVTSPNGGETWGVSTSHAVTWTKTGTFATVKIEYSSNGGSTYPNTITASTDAGSGSYTWTIPDDISSTCKVQVTNNLDAAVSDVSDTNFSIVGILGLTSPVGAERWTVGTNHNITWTRVGSISNVKLEYSTNSGSTYPNTIVASTPAAALSFTWSVPDSISKNVRVKVSDAANSTVSDASDANFTIQAGFAITSPNGGEVLAVAATHNITWTSVGSATTVRLDYSTDGGSNYDKNISTSTLNSGSFSWTVPDTVSAQCKVMISDYNDDLASDVSNSNFKIRGDLVVTAPNGGEAWVVGTAYNITWTKAGSIANVKLEYSTDGGTTYPELITGSTPCAAGSYSWTVPDTLSQNCRVKITDTGDAAVFDTSNAVFKIRGAFTLTAPNGGEVWEVGTVQNITWTMVGSVINAKIEYSNDGGSSYMNSIVATTDASVLSYPWLIPNDITTQLRVRISDVSDATVYDASNANFKIKGVLRITAPNGGEDWDVGTSHNITWVTTGSVTSVRLDYSTDSGTTYPGSIVASTPAAAGTYAWTIPDAISVDVKVKITNLSDATVLDASDADFKIKGRVLLIAPNGGEVWAVGATEAVTWSRVGSVANVKLEYSKDGGATYPNLIVASAAAAGGSYTWTIPDDIATTIRVRVSDASDSSVNDVSDANFKIRGNLILTAPNGGEIWLINSNQSITWTRFGSIVNAKIEYSVDAGVSYPYTIVGSVNAALQTYGWSIPDYPSTLVRVRISDASDSTVNDSSNANFTIRGGFDIQSPNGGEIWVVNSQHSITWTTFGSYANVKLWYSKDNGSTWDIITGSTPNSGAYVWTVPDAISAVCLVKIGDLADVEAIDVSNAAFRIRGQVNLTSPNGGEAWGVGTSQNITWTKTGAIPNFKLEYSTNAFANEDQTVLINAAIPGASLSYSWTVPDAIGTNLKVRVSDASDSVVNDVSDTAFRVRGALNLTAPNGGETWIVGSGHTLTWATQGSVVNVKLEYSTDAGSSWTIISASYANSGTFAWTVPDAISSLCRIRVSDATDSDANDISNNNFKIRGDLVITVPNGGEKWAVGANKVITWNRTGSIANVRLEYSDNGGTTYVPIIASTPNAGSYNWVLPDAITTQALVRVYDVGDLTVTDVSDAVFKIQGSFAVTAPNGGEAWQAASTNTIRWTSNGSVNFVKISYSKDSGTTWTEIVASTANDGEYDWFIPVEAVSTTERIMVADAGDAEAFDISNNDFRVRCTLVVTSPNNGTEHWRVGQTRNITWNKVGNPAAVKIEFSRDNFVTDFNTIVAAASPVSPYAWLITDNAVNPVSDTLKIRVSDASDTGANDVSDANFRITGDVTVTVPNGGQMWDVNSLQTITWSTAGVSPALNMPNIRIEYSTNGGASYDAIEAVPNSGSYLWTVPDTISAACRIRVSDLADATANDISDANFKIRAKFTVTSPNDGSEVWTVGDKHAITWTNVGTVNNARLDYSTDAGSTFSAIVASTPNTGSYEWTIPDAISTQCRVKVSSATDADAYDISDANFKIRGKFILTAPNGGELWRIALSYPITWTTVGTISNVRLLYSTDDGVTYPFTIVNSVANTNTYNWTLPDTRTPSARVKIVNVADTTVEDESDSFFRIQGSFILVAPNGAEEWTSESVHNITWNWGGTLPTVKLSYSIDSGATYPYVINAAAPNGAGGSGTFSYAWTVPGTVSNTCRVRVEDPADDTVNDASNADFKIRGEITVTAPAGGERWVTNEEHTIVWTQKGVIPNVKLQYSKDSFVSNVVTIAATVANSGSYEWTIPDDRAAAVKVRVLDTRDETIYGVSSGTFRIDYYTITWILRDLLTNVGLTNLAVIEKATGTENIRWSQTGLTSPVVTQAPYGFWTTTWSATGYGDKGQNYTADSDQTFELFMETTAVHIWRAEARFSWDADNRKLNATAWLERDGSIVTGVKSVAINIYDAEGDLVTTMNAPTTSAEGYFTMVYTDNDNKLQPGIVYAALVDLTNLSDAHFKTPTSLSITETERLKNTEEAVGNLVNNTLPTFQLSVQGTISTGIQEQKDMITEKMNEQSDLIADSMSEQTHLLVGDKSKEDILEAGGMIGMVESSLTSFETSANQAITRLEEGSSAAVAKLEAGATKATAAGDELMKTAKQFSWGVTVAPSPVMAGDNVTMTIQGQPKCQPLVSIYSWDGIPVIQSQIAIPDANTQGLYKFTFTADSNFAAGKAFTYLVTEQTTNGFVTGSAMVESMGITTVAGLAAAAPEAERAAKKALDAIKAVEAVLVSKDNINIAMTLQNLKESVESLPEQMAKEGGNTQVMSAVNEISEKLSKMLGDEGLDLSGLLDEKLGDTSTMKEMRNKTDSIQTIVDLLLQIIEGKLGGVDEPIVSTSLQSGSVKFRIVVVNPSKTKTQKVKIKKILPEEVQLKDIMDAGGLDLEFDAEKNVYYAYKNDVELQPGESRVYEVEVEDVWLIPETRISDLKKHVENARPRFRNTEFAGRVEELAKTAPAVLDEMLKTQVDETISREQHIGVYRQNLQTIKRIEEELAKLDQMISPKVGTQVPEVFEKNKLKINLPGKTTTWLIIMIIIVFLGLLAGVFFFVWQFQMKSGQDAQKQAAKDAFTDKKPEEKK